MNELLQYIITGFTVGSIYAIVALGFVTIYSVSKVINMAQGEFVMLGGMTMYTLTAAGIPYWVSFLLTIPLVMLVGIFLERLVIRPAKGADALSLIILTIGAAIFIRGLASIVWGKTPKKNGGIYIKRFNSNSRRFHYSAKHLGYGHHAYHSRRTICSAGKNIDRERSSGLLFQYARGKTSRD